MTSNDACSYANSSEWVGLVKGAFSRARDFTATGVKKERKQDGVLRSCDGA